MELGDPGDDGQSESRASGLARVEREKDLFSGSGIDPLTPVTDSQPRLAFGRALAHVSVVGQHDRFVIAVV